MELFGMEMSGSCDLRVVIVAFHVVEDGRKRLFSMKCSPLHSKPISEINPKLLWSASSLDLQSSLET